MDYAAAASDPAERTKRKEKGRRYGGKRIKEEPKWVMKERNLSMHKYTRALLISVAFLPLAGGSVIGTLSGQVQNKQVASVNEETTPVIAGVVTRRQIEHSKLYAQAGGRRKNLSGSAAGTRLIIGLPGADVSANRGKTFATYLQEITCQADAVVVGNVNSKESQLTTDGSFIFTDYELIVESVIKANPTVYLDSTSEITVTRPGE